MQRPVCVRSASTTRPRSTSSYSTEGQEIPSRGCRIVGELIDGESLAAALGIHVDAVDITAFTSYLNSIAYFEVPVCVDEQTAQDVAKGMLH